MFDFSGRVVVITGASSGLGLQMAQTFAEQKVKLVIIARRKERLDNLAKKICNKGGECLPICCDATNYEKVMEVSQYIEKVYGKVDILVNCASFGVEGGILEIGKNDWEKTILGTLSSVFYVTQAFAKIMVKKNYGRIINISSMHGLVGSSLNPMVAYQTAKGGVINFTRSVAAELADYNITCNVICPGYFATEQSFEREGEGGNEINLLPLKKFAKHVRSAVPMKRIGKEGEINAGVIFLASDEASYVTGAVLAIDGGYTAI